MRRYLVPTAALLAAIAAAPSTMAQTREVPVCSSREDAQRVMQTQRGAALPEDCRRATVRRVDTPSGPLCVIDIGQQNGGIVGAVATTEWWTACENLRAP